MLKSKGDCEHPCLVPLLTTIGSASQSSVLTTADINFLYPIYSNRISNNLSHLVLQMPFQNQQSIRIHLYYILDYAHLIFSVPL